MTETTRIDPWMERLDRLRGAGLTDMEIDLALSEIEAKGRPVPSDDAESLAADAFRSAALLAEIESDDEVGWAYLTLSWRPRDGWGWTVTLGGVANGETWDSGEVNDPRLLGALERALHTYSDTP